MPTTNGTRYTTTPTSTTVSTATTSSSSTYGPNNNSSDLFPSRSVLFTSSTTATNTSSLTDSISARAGISQTTQSSTLPSNYSSSYNKTPSTTTTGGNYSSTQASQSYLARNYQQPSKNESETSSDAKSSKPQPQFLPSLSGYQIPLRFDDLPRVSSLGAFGGGNSSSSSTSSTSSSSKVTATTTTSSSSPSRIDYSNTNTLPSSNVARNMLYQSESSYSIRSNQQTTNVASSGTSNMNIYGTLPKTSNPSSYLQSYSTNTSSSAISPTSPSNYSLSQDTSNLFERSSGDRTSPNTSASGSNDRMRDNYGGSNGGSSGINTQYRVQYASTNPFLPTFNPPPGEHQSVSPVPTISLGGNDDNEDDLK